MSFILDALRKSENERQRNTTPGIADAPIRQRTNRRSVWLPLVAVLLGLNVSLVVVLWYIGGETTTEPAPAVEAEGYVDTQPATRVVDRPVADPNVSRELSTELDPKPDTTAPFPAGEKTAFPAPANLPSDSSVIDVPTLAELTLDGSISLPVLHLDIHVYSEAPAERFVFINTSKYREGERTSEGPIVNEINPLGVILMHENRRFLLTRE
jgi:general secretion pathway protein B